jgi:hypothetical protein
VEQEGVGGTEGGADVEKVGAEGGVGVEGDEAFEAAGFVEGGLLPGEEGGVEFDGGAGGERLAEDFDFDEGAGAGAEGVDAGEGGGLAGGGEGEEREEKEEAADHPKSSRTGLPSLLMRTGRPLVWYSFWVLMPRAW